MEVLSDPDELRPLLQHHKSLQSLSVPGGPVRVSVFPHAGVVPPAAHPAQSPRAERQTLGGCKEDSSPHSPSPPTTGRTLIRAQTAASGRTACEERSKAFKNSWDLTRHRCVHTGAIPSVANASPRRGFAQAAFRPHRMQPDLQTLRWT